MTPEGILSVCGPSLFGVSSTALVMAHVARGTAIDTSTRGATFAGRAGQMQAVEDELIDVHGAVLDLPRFYVQLAGGADFVVWDRESLEVARENGWDVIRGGDSDRPSYRLATRRHDGPPAPGPRAYVKRALVEAPGRAPAGAPWVALHPIEPAVVLVTNGRAGTRPDVSPLVVARYRPRYAGNRKQAIGYDPVYETLPGVVALERATYAVWRYCLTLLVEQLQGLDRYRVTGPIAPAVVWGKDVAEAPQGRVAC